MKMSRSEQLSKPLSLCCATAFDVRDAGRRWLPQRAPESIGDALLSLAAGTGADLLVMGCYGHTRAPEWVLGGATRTVLESMTVPVLMAH